MDEILLIAVHEETYVVYRGQGIYQEGPGNFNKLISARDVAEALQRATSSMENDEKVAENVAAALHPSEIETYNALFIAERTPDEWIWPDIIETVLEYRKMCKHCKEAPHYPGNCGICEALNPYL